MVPAKAAGLSTLLAVGTELAVSDEDRLVRAIRDGAQDNINDAASRSSGASCRLRRH